ncbi:hypothetical protein BaRGS_00004827 [Batillaria attramentaria]|uniref:Uncharacterized protein n=1 Tax=Batillaria attramentaria TaxID=370345 RepID=A0ABD0LWS8_9CAEN
MATHFMPRQNCLHSQNNVLCTASSLPLYSELREGLLSGQRKVFVARHGSVKSASDEPVASSGSIRVTAASSQLGSASDLYTGCDKGVLDGT